nr:MAG TPA: hypothetical protein [Herelleviridae sp.]
MRALERPGYSIGTASLPWLYYLLLLADNN